MFRNPSFITCLFVYKVHPVNTTLSFVETVQMHDTQRIHMLFLLDCKRLNF